MIEQIEERAVAERLEAVQERIALACQRAGRGADEVTLVGVTKTFPLEAVEAARAAGLRHFGENKVQELVAKAERLPGAVAGGDIHWHMIGHLQRNKAKDVVAHADYFEALDSLRLARELDKRARREDRRVPCLVQVNVSGEESKYGVDPSSLEELLVGMDRFEHLRVEGLMTLAAPVEDPEEVRPQFRLLRELFERHEADAPSNVTMEVLSMGMSGDFEVAIEEGATIVRLGSAIFGPRTYE